MHRKPHVISPTRWIKSLLRLSVWALLILVRSVRSLAGWVRANDYHEYYSRHTSSAIARAKESNGGLVWGSDNSGGFTGARSVHDFGIVFSGPNNKIWWSDKTSSPTYA